LTVPERLTGPVAADAVMSRSIHGQIIDSEPSPEPVREAVAVVDAELRARALLVRRAPRQIAYWTLRQIWANYLEEVRRFSFDISQRRYPPLDFYRLLQDRVLNASAKLDTLIPAQLIQNLLRAEHPAELDGIFLVPDRYVSEHPIVSRPPSTSNVPDLIDPFPGKFDSEDLALLIDAFIAAKSAELETGLISISRSKVSHLLHQFLKTNPLHSLVSPDRILSALQAWYEDQVQIGVPAGRRRIHRKWLLAFLIYLRERSLIGELPRSHHIVVMGWQRLIANLRQLTVALPLIQMAAFITVFLLLSQVSLTTAHPPFAGAIWMVLDGLLFGGLLADGTLTAPLVGSILLACLISTAIWPNVGMTDQLLGLGRLLMWPLCMALSAWLLVQDIVSTDAHFSVIASSIMLFLLVLLLLRIAQQAIAALHIETGISLIAIWLCYTTAWVYPNLIATWAGNAALAGALYGATTIILVVWQHFSGTELQFLSLRLKAAASMASEEIKISIPVRGSTGPAPHVMGVLLAWSVLAVLGPPIHQTAASLSLDWQGAITATAYAIYLAGAAWITHQQLKQRLDPGTWHAEMNAGRQVYVTDEREETLDQALLRVRRQMFRREMILAAGVALAFSLGGYGFGFLPGSDIPLSLLALLGPHLLSFQGRLAATRTYRFVFNRGSIMPEGLELQKIKEPAENETLWERFMRIVNSRFIIILGIIVAVLKGMVYLVEGFRHLERLL
jgi:hypothetical protein